MNRTLTPADRLLRAGGVVTAVGMALTLVAITPLLSGSHLTSLWWGLSMITGIGLVLVLAGVRASSRNRSRTVANHIQGES